MPDNNRAWVGERVGLESDSGFLTGHSPRDNVRQVFGSSSDKDLASFLGA